MDPDYSKPIFCLSVLHLFYSFMFHFPVIFPLLFSCYFTCFLFFYSLPKNKDSSDAPPRPSFRIYRSDTYCKLKCRNAINFQSKLNVQFLKYTYFLGSDNVFKLCFGSAFLLCGSGSGENFKAGSGVFLNQINVRSMSKCSIF